MKTLVEKWTNPADYSFNVRSYMLANNPDGLLMRMHEEYEISLIPHSNGKRFVGDSIEEFEHGDLFLIGPQLPHAVQFQSARRGRVLTIHFRYDSFGEGFFDLPENTAIKDLLREGRLGVSFNGEKMDYFHRKILEMKEKHGFERMMAFIRLLNELSQLEGRKVLTSEGFTHVHAKKEYKLINEVYDYVMNRFEMEDISLGEISDHFHMAPNTFCRFFKRHFHKSFTKFLNEIRVGHACRMLQKTNKNISEIAYASGYRQLTHFNRQFKLIVGYSPREYRRELEGVG